jgi:hypothetical protein
MIFLPFTIVAWNDLFAVHHKLLRMPVEWRGDDWGPHWNNLKPIPIFSNKCSSPTVHWSESPMSRSARLRIQTDCQRRSHAIAIDIQVIWCVWHGATGEKAVRLLAEQFRLSNEVIPWMMLLFDHNGKEGLGFWAFAEFVETMTDLKVHPRRFFRLAFDLIDTNRCKLLVS